MSGVARGEPVAGVVVGRAESVGKTVLVFPGQGSQWAGMGGSCGIPRRCLLSR